MSSPVITWKSSNPNVGVVGVATLEILEVSACAIVSVPSPSPPPLSPSLYVTTIPSVASSCAALIKPPTTSSTASSKSVIKADVWLWLSSPTCKLTFVTSAVPSILNEPVTSPVAKVTVLAVSHCDAVPAPVICPLIGTLDTHWFPSASYLKYTLSFTPK